MNSKNSNPESPSRGFDEVELEETALKYAPDKHKDAPGIYSACELVSGCRVAFKDGAKWALNKLSSVTLTPDLLSTKGSETRECTTHHFACDCREEMFLQMAKENADMKEKLKRVDEVIEELTAKMNILTQDLLYLAEKAGKAND